MGLDWSSSTERKIRVLAVAEADPSAYARTGCGAGLEGVQVDTFVLQGSAYHISRS